MGAQCCFHVPEGVGEQHDNQETKLAFLSEVKLLQRLPKADLPLLADCAVQVMFKKGDAIITQGEEGDEFFVIQTGTASVYVDDKEVGTLSDGDYFGEVALLRSDVRSATILATTAIKALRITRLSFWNLGLNVKLEFPKRAAVGGGYGAVVSKPPSSKTEAEKKLLMRALKNNVNLNACIFIEDAVAKELIGLMWKEVVPADTALIKEGDMTADYFYIVQEGSFLVTKEKKGAKSAESVYANCGTISSGGSFGELALMYHAPRAATVTATTQSSVWVIDRDQFRNQVAKAEEGKGKKYVAHLDTVDILKDLTDAEKLDVANALTRMEFSKGDVIFDQGEAGDKFYVLLNGSVSVIKDKIETAKLTATSSKACIFGELALLDDKPRTATIKVISDTAMALWMNKQSFEILIGPLGEIKKRGRHGKSRVAKLSLFRQTLAVATSGFGNIKLKDLKTRGLLGCGGFGAVEMVEHVTTGECYALKKLSKGYVLKSGTIKIVMSEKEVQLMCESPFIIKLYETFNEESHLSLLLELAIGGELYATYMKNNLWGDLDLARFYVAGTTIAFVHLHGLNIMYRDLKPENLLLTDTGAVKLTDMGLAKVVASKTYTTCGTPYYFAPELIAAKGYNYAVDWWTLGILTYELTVGSPPFDANSPMAIYKKIQQGIDKVVFPKRATAATQALVKGMCDANPAQRLPMKSGGVGNIKGHAWFEDKRFDWKKMEDLTMTPPYKPPMKHKKDKSNFQATEADMPPQLPYVDPGSGWDNGWATST